MIILTVVSTAIVVILSCVIASLKNKNTEIKAINEKKISETKAECERNIRSAYNKFNADYAALKTDCTEKINAVNLDCAEQINAANQERIEQINALNNEHAQKI